MDLGKWRSELDNLGGKVATTFRYLNRGLTKRPEDGEGIMPNANQPEQKRMLMLAQSIPGWYSYLGWHRLTISNSVLSL